MFFYRLFDLKFHTKVVQYMKFIESKKASSKILSNITLSDGRKLTEKKTIANGFNQFISNHSLPNFVSDIDCVYFINNNLNRLKANGQLTVPSNFKIAFTCPDEVLELIKGLDITFSAGITGIPVKIIIYCQKELSFLISSFFNLAIRSGKIPAEWKYSLVTPLYKEKGNADNFDNY